VFELSKWYADAVSADGDFRIGYCARLRYRRLSVPYSSIVDARGQRHSPVGQAPQLTGSGDVHWRVPALEIDARWQRSMPEIRKTIYESAEGVVDWHCVLPRGAVSDGAFNGLGYVEHLRLTLPPWRLPIRTLRWGRFLSPRNSLIWIDWQGDFTSRTVFLNGRPAVALALEDDAIALDDGTRITFDRGLTIRWGTLGSTVLNAIPGLDQIAPLRILQVEECKWLSRSSLDLPGEEPDRGWSIHEVVRWP
jgi:hypothetical protein